jgi:hypothetical protein
MDIATTSNRALDNRACWVLVQLRCAATNGLSYTTKSAPNKVRRLCSTMLLREVLGPLPDLGLPDWHSEDLHPMQTSHHDESFELLVRETPEGVAVLAPKVAASHVGQQVAQLLAWLNAHVGTSCAAGG